MRAKFFVILCLMGIITHSQAQAQHLSAADSTNAESIRQLAHCDMCELAKLLCPDFSKKSDNKKARRHHWWQRGHRHAKDEEVYVRKEGHMILKATIEDGEDEDQSSTSDTTFTFHKTDKGTDTEYLVNEDLVKLVTVANGVPTIWSMDENHVLTSSTDGFIRKYSTTATFDSVQRIRESIPARPIKTNTTTVVHTKADQLCDSIRTEFELSKQKEVPTNPFKVKTFLRKDLQDLKALGDNPDPDRQSAYEWFKLNPGVWKIVFKIDTVETYGCVDELTMYKLILKICRYRKGKG